MRKPSWHNGSLEFVDVSEEGVHAPTASSRTTLEGNIPVPNPIMDRQISMDENTKSANDDAVVVFYKCDCGRYVTDSMIAQGICAGHMMRYGVAMSDEEAEDLAVQLEAMSLDTELTENETVLLKMIRAKLGERWM